MGTVSRRRNRIALLAIPLVGWLLLGRADAHCDTLDGPVVRDAQAALTTGELRPVLKWLRPVDEAEVRAAFDDALAVRALGERAASIGRQRFFETLVRLHRAGEGAGFTGLKPAGQVEPVVALADRALDEGSAEELIAELQQAVESGVRQRFAEARERRATMNDNVEAGRAYVASYVELMHYLEALHQTAAGHVEHRAAETASHPEQSADEPVGHP